MDRNKPNTRDILAEVRAERASKRRGERELAQAIVHCIHMKNWSLAQAALAQAALACRLSETRMQDLLEGRGVRFSFGRLVPIANRIRLGALNEPGVRNLTPPKQKG